MTDDVRYMTDEETARVFARFFFPSPEFADDLRRAFEAGWAARAERDGISDE